VLIAVYAVFALSASARAGVQIATKFGHAPVAYLLSAFAAVVYILATVTLAVGSPAARRIAVLSCSVEFVGVLAVGTWSIADPATFPDATVWSGYGSGYGFVPLVLPVLGLLWLRRWTRRAGHGLWSSSSAQLTAEPKADLVHPVDGVWPEPGVGQLGSEQQGEHDRGIEPVDPERGRVGRD
jgi:hypothetical protein